MVRHAKARENHGASNTPLWDVWNQMLARCSSPTHPSYRWYGARGIRVCEEWRVFTTFRAWAESSGYRQGLSLDRISSDKDYAPENCQWIPLAENTRKNRNLRWIVNAFGESKTIGQWIADSRCKVDKESSLRMRISRGWNPEVAIQTPNNRKGSR